MSTRVVVTGMGVVTSTGAGVEELWRGLLEPVPEDPVTGARLFDEYNPKDFFPSRQMAKRDTRLTHFALIASDEALSMSPGFTAESSGRRGVLFSATNPEQPLLESMIDRFNRTGDLHPLSTAMVMANAAAANIAIHHKWTGLSSATGAACASGNMAVHFGQMMIRSGRYDAVLCGGGEAPDTAITLPVLQELGIISPSGSARPFDSRRDGTVMSEGAAVLLLESYEHAIGRGAEILAEVLGTAATSDAYHIVAPEPTGSESARCLSEALADAGVSPHEVKAVFAHGTATEANDRSEALALHAAFGGKPSIPVLSLKGRTGHTWGASGTINCIAAIKAFQYEMLPPTTGFGTYDPEIPALNVSADQKTWEPGITIANCSGFGGHNACVVLCPFPTQIDLTPEAS